MLQTLKKEPVLDESILNEKIEVDPDWWKATFDEVYLMTDARSVCDDAITSKEIDVILGLLPIASNHVTLDLCGGHGRHSFELSSRDCGRFTVVDYSDFLLCHAMSHAGNNGHKVSFIRSDVRKTPVLSGSCDNVLILGNSLGYLDSHGADFEIVSEAFRTLKKGGRILIDVTDGDQVKKTFIENSTHEADNGHMVTRKRQIINNRMCVREITKDKSAVLLRDNAYSVRLYSQDSLAMLLKSAGFTSVDVTLDFSPHEKSGDYGFMNKRMIAVGAKP